MNKKAIGIGQVFIFIVAAITFALIMIFGYKIIGDFLSQGEKVAFVEFKTDLEKSVQKIHTEFGAVRIENFFTPMNFEQICFVDLDEPFDEGLCQEDIAACDVWETAEQEGAGKEGGGYGASSQNVFLKPSASVPIKVNKITIDPEEEKNYLCLPIKQGKFSLILEGKGDHTELSRK